MNKYVVATFDLYTNESSLTIVEAENIVKAFKKVPQALNFIDNMTDDSTLEDLKKEAFDRDGMIDIILI